MSSDVSGHTQRDHLIFCRRWLHEQGLAEAWEAVIPEPNELFLDFDRPDLPDDWEVRWGILLQVFPNASYGTTSSKSGNLHVIVDLGEPIREDLYRVAWQAALGSDPKRELLHLKSLKHHELHPIILFERRSS